MINGVNMLQLQKKKMSTTMKKSVSGTSTPRGTKKKEMNTTTSSGKISNYFVKKTKDKDDCDIAGRQNSTAEKTKHREEYSTEEGRGKLDRKKETLVNKNTDDEKKTTFNTISVKKRQSTMKEHISMFQKLADGEDCVIWSGRCSSHNAKLVRSVVKKKVCSVNENGTVSWPMGEAVILACPYAKRSDREVAAGASYNQFVGTNGRKKLCVRNDIDDNIQSHSGLAEKDLAGRHPIGGDLLSSTETE